MVSGLWWKQKTSTYQTAGKPSTSSRWSLVMAFLPCVKCIDWRSLYRAAILETNKGLLRHRVLDAEEAVIARGREIFYGNGTPEEEEALDDALYTLHAFRSAWQHGEAA